MSEEWDANTLGRFGLSQEFFGLMHTLSEFGYNYEGREAEVYAFAKAVREGKPIEPRGMGGQEILIYQWVKYNVNV